MHLADRDLREPRAQGRLLPQTAHLFEGKRERVLNDVFRVGGIDEKAQDHAGDEPHVASVDRLFRAAIAGAGTLDERRILDVVVAGIPPRERVAVLDRRRLGGPG
jgi:hypothetical protein